MAYVSHIHNNHTDFDCYKYVSDNTDEAASEDWITNVAKGAQLFMRILEKNYGSSYLLSTKNRVINPS